MDGGLDVPVVEEESGGEDDKPYTDIPIPADIQTLADALVWISGNAEADGAYTVTVKAGETIPAQSLSYDGKRVSVTLKGDTAGREVSLSDGGSLFTVESGVTLNVENLTLKGRGNIESFANGSALVRVRSGGALRLKAGAVITGNYTTTNHGGGVKVEENAEFTMEGGTISGNTSGIGGGVGVDKGTFTMKGGEISGNTATEWGGGGVQVFLSNDGRAAGLSGNGSFTMEGGTISNNTAKGGGGVEAGGSFTLKGGTISDNIAQDGDADGGGVKVGTDSTYTMENGTISGNTAQEHSGGGVWVDGGSTFTKTGGTIYGDDDNTHTPDSDENTSLNGQGHAVGFNNEKKRDATLDSTHNISTGDPVTNWDN
ncbi:MAG: hypothetical protein LBF78_14215 [Treponema sp.]|nr:hypothetical protein [Treponema sp.]